MARDVLARLTPECLASIPYIRRNRDFVAIKASRASRHAFR